MFRHALHSDIEQLIHMARMMYDESDLKSQRLNPAKVSVTIDALINTGFAGVYEIDGKIIGMMGGALSESYFSTDYIATDYCLYVVPEHRGSLAAVRLVSEYRKWAMSDGVKPGNIMIGISSGVNNDMAAAVCESVGFEKCGFIMRGK